jgi:hypothetical protein
MEKGTDRHDEETNMFGLYLLVLSAQALPPQPPGEATIAALGAGLEQWRKTVQFRSTFRLREGTAKSVEAGLRDGVDPSLPRGVVEATGVFHRQGELMRFTLDYGRPPVPVPPALGLPPPPPGGGSFQNVSYDEVTNGRIQVRYHPGPSGDNVSVEPRRPDVIGAGQFAQSEINPLYPYRNPRFDPFKPWDLGRQQPSKRDVTAVDDGQTEVKLTTDGEWKQTRRMRFRTAPGIAVLTEIVEIVTTPQGKNIETHVRRSDFRDCPGGPVARRVVSVLKAENDAVVVREWVSPDLGDRPPAEADFVIRIGPRTSVGGYRNAPPRGSDDRRIDITAITKDDLDNGVR